MRDPPVERILKPRFGRPYHPGAGHGNSTNQGKNLFPGYTVTVVVCNPGQVDRVRALALGSGD